jgi:sporulation protein YlmC with PRC-barrel domain
MKISSDDLLGLPVYTQSGSHLGKVTGVDVEIDSHLITHYHVRTGLIKDLWHHELLIAREQVISVNAKKMIVDDSASSKIEQPLRKPKLATS